MEKSNIDLKYRKPRRTRGTPVYRIRNYVALGVIGTGALFGALFHYTTFWKRVNQAINNGYFDETEEEAFRKFTMGFVATNRSDKMKERMSLKGLD